MPNDITTKMHLSLKVGPRNKKNILPYKKPMSVKKREINNKIKEYCINGRCYRECDVTMSYAT